MKVVTNSYKNNVKLFGRELDSKITYTINNEEIELGNEELNSVSLHYEGGILKSVMKQLDIDSNIEIPLETILTYEFGVKVENEYEYINYGNFIVYNVEKQEDTNSYKITCYDKMLYSMKDYTNMNLIYPMTIRNYIIEVCDYLGLTFANINDNFANYNREIPYELYLDSQGNSLGYTFRDVLDEIAQATASTICINDDDELEIRYITSTNDTIDEEYLKDVNVNFGEKYGPINSVVLSRSAESDNVYLSDETSIENDGLCEIKIVDNQIMNRNDRSDYLPDIFSKLGGLEYYLNDFSSTGICYYDICDRYNISIGESVYSCVMFNDEINITQGLEENIFAEMPDQGETDYTKADKTDRKINQTYFIVDKQNQQIESMISTVDEQNTKIAHITQTVDEINSKISDVTDLTISGETNSATLNLSGINASEPIQLIVHPVSSPGITLEYPRSNLYPSILNELLIRKIRFHNNTTNEDFDYELPDNLLYYNSSNYDEFTLDYGDGTPQTQVCKVVKKCEYNSTGQVVLKSTPVTTNYTYPSILLTNGDYTISILTYAQGYLFTRLMAQNIYTIQFYTKAETNSIINQTANSITLGVNQTLSNYSTTTEMNSAITLKANEINSVVSQKVGNNEVISKINQTPESITINANKISLAGKTINMTSDNIAISSTNFSVSSTGNITANGGNIAGWQIASGYLAKNFGNYAIEMRTDRNADAYALLVYDIPNQRYNWGVTPQGYMYARNCNITGTISSSSGNIGGWSIDSQGLYTTYGGYVAITPTDLYASSGGEVENRSWWSIVMNYPSDIKTKNNVKDLSNKYENFYDKLIPVSFEYKDEYEERKKGSTHFGFVAQDIEKNIEENNIEDLALIYGNKLLKLNKEEIIALNTWQIQKLKKQVKEQQQTINKLIERIEKLERESDK